MNINIYDLQAVALKYMDVDREATRQAFAKKIAWTTIMQRNCSGYDTEQLAQIELYQTAIREFLCYMDTGQKPSGNFGIPEPVFSAFLDKLASGRSVYDDAGLSDAMMDTA